jgi:CRISPR type III-B/RAMP module-associated protein Cmr5
MRKSTVDQERAKFALERIERVLSEPALHEKRKKFLIELRHLPGALHWGGLGQTAASLLADRKNEPRLRIHEWLQDWLLMRVYTTDKAKKPTLMQAITGSGDFEQLAQRYVAATREARALAVWLKKFAEAFLRTDEEGSKKETGDAVAAS